MGKPAEVLAGTNYSCSLLAHTPEPKCLRLGSQEADLKTKINVQVVYLKKCSQRRLIGDWGNKAGQYGNPLQYSCLENPHEQRRLVGCSPWGLKESDTTEQQSTAAA